MTRPEPAWTPPLRNGVGASRVGIADASFPTLLDFLTARFPAVDNWTERIAQGGVLDSLGHPVQADAPCRTGMLLWYWRDPPHERRIPFEIELLHRDDHLVVVDKPHFLPVIPGGRHLMETVLVRLKQQLGIATLAPMHRLDRDTAGVLVFTVQPATRHAYQSLLRDRRVRKLYEAVAPWRADLALPVTVRSRLEEPAGRAFMQMRLVPGEPNAETRIELIERLPIEARAPGELLPELAHYSLLPTTGRRHQLRAQMNALGLPIVGDRIYPHLLPEPATGDLPDHTQPLQLLAREFAFTDPLSGEPRCFVSRCRLQLARQG